MKFLKRFLSSWANLVAFAVAIAVFLVSPVIIRWYDPTAGMFDSGVLQTVSLAAFFTFSEATGGWILWQLIFASLDRATQDEKSNWGSLDRATQSLPSLQFVLIVQGTFVFCIALFAFNIWLVTTLK